MTGSSMIAVTRPLHVLPAVHHHHSALGTFTVTSLPDGRRSITGHCPETPYPLEIRVELDQTTQWHWARQRHWRPIGSRRWLEMPISLPPTDDHPQQDLLKAADRAYNHALDASNAAVLNPHWSARATAHWAERRLHVLAAGMRTLRVGIASGTPWTPQLDAFIQEQLAPRHIKLAQWRSLARAGLYADGPVLTTAVDVLQAHPTSDVDVVLAALGVDPATTAPLTTATPTSSGA